MHANMWNGGIRDQMNAVGDNRRQGQVAVAVDKEKSSQHALKWAVENLYPRDKPLKLVHVVNHQRSSSSSSLPPLIPNSEQESDLLNNAHTAEVLLPYRCFCTRRQVPFETVILHDPDVATALTDYVSFSVVETLVIGASSRNALSGFSRIFKNADIPSTVLKWAPAFCNVYVITKGRVSAMRPASRSAPTDHHQRTHHPMNHPMNFDHQQPPPPPPPPPHHHQMSYDELSIVENDNSSIVSSGRLSTDSNCLSFYENLGSGLDVFESSSSNLFNLDDDGNLESLFSGNNTMITSSNERPLFSLGLESMEDEMRRLKIELKQTMDMYHAACKEALASKHKAIELEELKIKDQQKMKEVELAAMALVEKEKARCKAAIEEAQRCAAQEVEKRVLRAEMKALVEAEENHKVWEALGQSHTVLKYQSLFHIIVVLFLFYLYFSLFN